MKRKFIEEKNVDGDSSVLTPDGYRPIKKIFKTVPYPVFRIKLDNGTVLDCADDHILITAAGEEVFAKDSICRVLQTVDGPSEVISVIDMKYEESMYDLELYDGHLYYCNGVLSHNTTTVAAYFCHYVIFNGEKTVAILANKNSIAKEILGRIKLMIENLPDFLKPNVLEWNKNSVEFENGSKIIAAATSSTAVRGMSINCLLLDEFSFISAGVFEDFIQSVYPTISSSKESKIFMVSTPNGMNHFYKFWKEAVDNINGYVPVSVKWNDVPGRDEEWKKQMIAEIGEQRWLQEFECSFLGSRGTLIDIEVLQNIPYSNPLYHKYNNKLKVYEKPSTNNYYVMFVDVAEGNSTTGDYSTVQVIKISKNEWKQVAVFRDNTIKPRLFSGILNDIGKMFNSALAVIENNTIGLETINNLNYNEEYENIFFDSGKFGLRMTKSTKRIGCSYLKTFMENGMLVLQDFETIQEFTTFVKKKNGTYSAENGKTDDLVTPLILFSYFMSVTDFVDNWIEINRTDVLEKLRTSVDEMIEEDLLPIGEFPDSYYEDEL